MAALWHALARNLLGARTAELELVGVCALGRLSPCGQGRQQGEFACCSAHEGRLCAG